MQAVYDPCSLNLIATAVRKNIRTARKAGHQIQIFWIKAHARIIGNERADKLAKQAALTNKRALAYYRFPLSFAKRSI